jgi:multicomponent Na+:H+ antiporter subunit E
VTRTLRLLRNTPHVLAFVGLFLVELVLANLRVAREIVTPGLDLRPGIVRVPTEDLDDWEMLVLANTLTMTPGTLSLQVDDVTRDLYVHSLYVDSREAFVADVKRIERAMLKAVR